MGANPGIKVPGNNTASAASGVPGVSAPVVVVDDDEEGGGKMAGFSGVSGAVSLLSLDTKERV